MNTTVNESSCSILLNPTADKLCKTIAYCLIIVVSLVGNSCIAIIVYKTTTLRKPINYFIVNMALSDLLFPISLFPLLLASLYVDSWLISGPLAQAFCKLVPFLADVFCIVSIQSLVLIAVDRFGAVVFPLRSPLISSKHCAFCILATWIVSMAVNSPDLFAYKLVEYQGRPYCAWQWNEAFGESSSEANFTLASDVVFVNIPFALITVLYSIVIIKLKTQIFPGEQSVNVEEQRARRNRNVLKMAIAIVLAFALCRLPLNIIHLLLYFAWDSTIPNQCDIYLITQFMAISNCAINPFICFAFSGNYRRGFRRILKCFG